MAGPLFSQEALQRAILNTPAEQAGPAVAGQLSSMATAPSDSATSWAPAPPGKLGVAPIAALLGGQALDAASSVRGFNHGNVEQNPLYTWMGQQPSAGLVALKALQSALALHAMKKLAAEGHPTMANIIGYGAGAAGAIPGIYNLTRPDQPK